MPRLALRHPRISLIVARATRGHQTVSRRCIYSTPLQSSHTTLRSRLEPLGPRATSRSSSHGGQSTIFALSTASGRAAIAVVRISGPACLTIYQALCPGKPKPKPRVASVRKIYNPAQPQDEGSVLDPSALILYFPQPNTVTGEDVLEIHVHGGPAVVQAVLQAIPKCQLPHLEGSIRFAEPGEFTRRAFNNDRLDLTQVEALGDILSATTEQQRRLSVRGTSNVLSKQYHAWRKQLLYARGELEALIDFSEDQHFDESPAQLFTSVAAQVSSLVALLEIHSRNAVRGELLRNGISLSLLGAPNVGKSSLLNRIVGREAAIVSHQAGTTRDVVEVGVDLGGYLCRLGDTAGLRLAINPTRHDESCIGEVEQEGMRRAKERAADSDVVIVVFDFQSTAQGITVGLDPEVIETATRLLQDGDKVIVALNKVDLANPSEVHEAVLAVQQAIPGLAPNRTFTISCNINAGTVSHESIQTFLQGLVAHFDQLTAALAPDSGSPDSSIWQESLGATERHRLLLEQCTADLVGFLELANAMDGSDDGPDIVIAAEHLRSAAESLAKITGRGEAGDVEEVLGVVFEKFCVGK